MMCKQNMAKIPHLLQEFLVLLCVSKNTKDKASVYPAIKLKSDPKY